MKRLLIFLVLVGFTQLGYSQSLIQTFTDRCTGETKVFSIAMQGNTTVVFYNKSRTFTAADVTSGAFQAWLEETYAWWLALSPCSTNQANTTSTQNTTQQTTTNATNAATNATSSANTGNTTTNNTTTNNTSTSNTSTGGTTSSGSTDSGTSGTTGSTETSSNNTSGGTDTGSTDNSNTNTNDTSNGNGTSDSGTTDSGGTSDSGSTDNSSEGSGSTDNSSDSSSGDSGTGDSSGDGDGSSSDSSGGEEGDNSDQGGDSSEGDSSEGDSGDNSEEGSGDSEDSSGDTEESESSEEDSKSESEESEDKETEEEVKEEEEKKEEESEEEKKDEDKEESDEESEEDSEEESDEEESDDEESEEDEEEDSEEESDNEEEEEDDEDEKKKRLAPPIVTANLVTMQMLDGTLSTAVSFGVSQSSLTGVETYSVNGMVWSNLKQFMLGGGISTVYFKYDRKQPRMIVDPNTGKYYEFGHTMEQGSIWSIDSHNINFMYMFGTTMASYTYSQVYLGQKDNFWKGFVGGYAATASIVNSFGKVSSSNSITGFGTKPFNFKKLPRWTFSPMVAVSLPLRVMPLDLKVDPFNNFTYIIGNNMNFAISQRFVANLGVTTISNTDKNIPMTFAATIGSRFQF